ncbi:MAG: enoyl-CoA hydratase/isomerase family protein [Aestuariivita sp.]|nr:enoyl-CoA hydratase/isomerase family protein [Aestuariivita sp.]MCY4346184.1 enoyl-CoA hydratase/isomerase family protein [Aestuariivita sp.]
MNQTLKIESQGATRNIILNRPQVLNAMNWKCVLDVTQAIREAEDDQEIRTIVLSGSGDRAFTAGADIAELDDMGSAAALRYNRDWLDMFRRIEQCRKPVIAAVDGWATGGGTELSLACDFVIAAESARFGLSEINIGVIPGAGAGVRLTRWVGRLRAKELLMLGRILTGREAVEWQLANQCVPTDKLQIAVQELTDNLNSRAPLALGAAKATVNVGSEASQELAMEYELQEFVQLFGTDDQREGMSAFLEKRSPKFKGR